MKVAVIGSQGQLGSDLVEVLRDRGHEVLGLGHAEIEVTEAASVNECLSAWKPDTVINCAAYVRVDDAEDNGQQVMNTNAVGSLNVARSCRNLGARCLYISTDFVFDGNQAGPYNEDDRVNPINVYGVSKLAGELMALGASTDCTIIRISSLFGKAGSSGKGGNFVEAILTKARAEGHVSVIDDIDITPTYALDAAKAIEELIRTPSAGIYHVANSGVCTWHQFAKMAIELAGVKAVVDPINSSDYPLKARRPANSALATDRLLTTIGRRLPPWPDALRDYLRLKGHL